MAMLFTILASAAVLSLGYFLYDFGRQGYERDAEAIIDTEMASLLLEDRLDAGSSMKQIVNRRISPGSGVHYLLSTIEGTLKAGDLSEFPVEVERIKEGVILFSVGSAGGSKSPQRLVAAKIHTMENGDQLLVARDIGEISARFARLRLLSVMSIICMLLVVMVAFLISLFVVSRINRMSDTALHIMQTGDLSRRLEVDSRWDDLSHLSRVFNEMLSRIEGLLEGVKQVSDSIAHDLRTPLTRLRNRLEQLQEGEPGREDVQSLIDEADQLLSTFQSLLRISRMDAGKEQAAFAGTDMRKILEDVVELYFPLAEERRMRLILESASGQLIRGDRNLLFQAIANLIDNAIKHGEGGDRIICRMTAADSGGLELTVEDTGKGISDSQKKRVFERFYRGDASRSTRGTGLGLSLVESIVRLHGGKITLYDVVPQGLGIRISLPARPGDIN